MQKSSRGWRWRTLRNRGSWIWAAAWARPSAALRGACRKAWLLGITRVPWQVENARALNHAAGCGERVRVVEGDYEETALPSASYDGVYALESSCHAHGADKGALLAEAHRLLRPGGRFVVSDGFLARDRFANALQKRIYRKLCECWVIEQLAQLDRFRARLENLGFTDITIEHLQMRVAPSVAHIPWVTLKFLWTDVVFGRKQNDPRPLEQRACASIAAPR